jgi:hypothetical protein
MSNESRDYAFMQHKAHMQSRIFRIPLETSWDKDKNNWKAKILCQGDKYGPVDNQIYIAQPKMQLIEYPNKEKTGEGVPICMSKKYQWLLLKISDSLFGFKFPDVFYDESYAPGFYVDLAFAHYPTLLKKYPSWNIEPQSRILQYILDTNKDHCPEYKELIKPLTEIEMETYEAEFALRGIP